MRSVRFKPPKTICHSWAIEKHRNFIPKMIISDELYWINDNKWLYKWQDTSGDLRITRASCRHACPKVPWSNFGASAHLASMSKTPPKCKGLKNIPSRITMATCRCSPIRLFFLEFAVFEYENLCKSLGNWIYMATSKKNKSSFNLPLSLVRILNLFSPFGHYYQRVLRYRIPADMTRDKFWICHDINMHQQF